MIATVSQNFPVEVVPSNFEETLDKKSFPQPWRSLVLYAKLHLHYCYIPIFRYVEETALGKAKEVASRLADRHDWAVVIGADTVVVSFLPSTGCLMSLSLKVLGDRILEKPGSEAVAREMLTRWVIRPQKREMQLSSTA